MTGGTAYVLDLDNSFSINLNPELVSHKRLETEEDVVAVKELIYKHLERTDSARAKEILGNWNRYEPQCWKIQPLFTPPVPSPSVEATPSTASTAKS
jgi:glutamate synthase (NADPH/NADH) large chain/glutamate synthase (ferredoxin)